jgi:hypothetical protein
MKNAEGKVMTLEEATTLLTRVLVDLAQNAVHNKRLTDYADELERYITALQEQNKEEERDEPKAE